jgi:hypothetical protein
MTEPRLAGTTIVVSSMFGLGRNSCSLYPLQAVLDIWRIGLPDDFPGGLFSEEPVGKSKDCVGNIPCTRTLYARAS